MFKAADLCEEMFDTSSYLLTGTFLEEVHQPLSGPDILESNKLNPKRFRPILREEIVLARSGSTWNTLLRYVRLAGAVTKVIWCMSPHQTCYLTPALSNHDTASIYYNNFLCPSAPMLNPYVDSQC